MSRTWWLVATVSTFLLVVGILSITAPRKAHCNWCPSMACYGAGGCGNDCVCLFDNPNRPFKGRCVSFE